MLILISWGWQLLFVGYIRQSINLKLRLLLYSIEAPSESSNQEKVPSLPWASSDKETLIPVLA